MKRKNYKRRKKRVKLHLGSENATNIGEFPAISDKIELPS